MSLQITGQNPVVTQTNAAIKVTTDHIVVTGAQGTLAFELGAATNCTAAFDPSPYSGDHEFIVTPTANFYGVATVLIRVNDGVEDSNWFVLKVGVQSVVVGGGGQSFTEDGSTITEGQHRTEKRIKKDHNISAYPEDMRRNKPFYSTDNPYL